MTGDQYWLLVQYMEVTGWRLSDGKAYRHPVVVRF
jgi:hypothetical protein